MVPTFNKDVVSKTLLLRLSWKEGRPICLLSLPALPFSPSFDKEVRLFLLAKALENEAVFRGGGVLFVAAWDLTGTALLHTPL